VGKHETWRKTKRGDGRAFVRRERPVRKGAHPRDCKKKVQPEPSQKKNAGKNETNQ